MFQIFTLCFLILKCSDGQESGMFWWQNELVKKYHGHEIPAPKFETVEESDKLVFKNWLDFFDVFNDDNNTVDTSISTYTENGTGHVKNVTEEINDRIYFGNWNNSLDKPKKDNDTRLLKPSDNPKNDVEFFDHNDTDCVFITKFECKMRGGSFQKRPKTASCCKMNPKKIEDIVVFREDPPGSHRHKRSPEDQRDSMNQLKALIQRNLGIKPVNLKSQSPTQLSLKIVTPDDDYEDPYANIRPGLSKHTPKPNRYGDPVVYDEVYSDELPKPGGLTGIYSDHSAPGAWAYDGDDSDEDCGYGGTTIDPRLGNRKSLPTQAPPIRRRIPVLLSSLSSEDTTIENDSDSANFQTNPNFNVLRGFKLLNYMRNKTRIYTKKITKHDYDASEADSEEESSYTDLGDFIDKDTQVYAECGRVQKKAIYRDKRSGEAPFASNPWIALVVRTRGSKRVLCHATLVHPRAAVTVANCVFGSSSGEVTLHAGIWDLEEDAHGTEQRRLTTAHLHHRYTPGDAAHDLALLHWNRPLRLGIAVQPVCLAEPHIGDECSFTGWGGPGEDIFKRLRYQSATILPPRDCNSCQGGGRRHKYRKDMFCAATDDHCVVGTGGALVCQNNGRHALVGVVIGREQCDVTTAAILLPAHEWVRNAMTGLGIV